MTILSESRACAYPNSLTVTPHVVPGTPLPPVPPKTMPDSAAGATRQRGASGAVGVSLGTTAKYSSATHTVDPDTGEVLSEKGEFDSAISRMERFALQSAVRKIMPNSRTIHCLRHVQKSKAVEVWQSREYQTCSYKGLQTCGSVWACPVCSAKISERRRVELIDAMEKHKANGGQVLLATFTTPHYLGDDLAEVLAGQAKALKYLNAGRKAVAAFSMMGCIGKIRALEVTHGRLRPVNNGWHPHYHILLFVRSGLDLDEWQGRLGVMWIEACQLAGVPSPSLLRGVKLEDGGKAANYASKWGLESEMTKGHTKKATNGGETPFDLLRAYLSGGDKHAAVLFREFAETFKGKRQLHWSPGLKKRFEIGEMTDEELAVKQDDAAALLGQFTVDEWRKVLRAEGRGIVLELAVHGWDAVMRYIQGIRDEKTRDDGRV